MKKKRGVTLLALVITIVIMLLLAAIVIQMALGENGLVAKSIQARKEQAKAELYETVKLSYINLKSKALENGQPVPETHLALSTIEFRDRYDIVGDNVVDKKGTVVDTKENLLNELKGSSPIVSPTWPKLVAGVTIPEEDKEKMILKLKVQTGKVKTKFNGNFNYDYGQGIRQANIEAEFDSGEHVIKLSGYSSYRCTVDFKDSDYSIEVLQWGKGRIMNGWNMDMYNISKIHEPEPEEILVNYRKGKFTEIPEWLFSKKGNSQGTSKFFNCDAITTIPENLFKNCVNVKNLSEVFYNCKGLTSIPENLFKYNTEVVNLVGVFNGCENITSIPENLFKYNTKVNNLSLAFSGNKKITSIPENLFKYNTEVVQLERVFEGCENITNIPTELFKYNIKLKKTEAIFGRCKNIANIPENLFKYNRDLENIRYMFSGCQNITSIPENLFANNSKIKQLENAFEHCNNISIIPEAIIQKAKEVKENGGIVKKMFIGCTSASNYASIPEYLKQ